jgi:hypothetical protein
MHLKNLTKHFEKTQNGRKIQNGDKNQCFRIFSPKSSVFNRFQKICIRSVFLLSKFCRRHLKKNGDLVQDGVILFLAKIDFFQEGLSNVDSTFFKF